MSTFYNGVAGNETARSTKSISSSTNATPIVVTLAAAHGFSDGDRVEVTGHATNTTANGIFTITVVDSTRISLNGSAGTAVGGATGSVVLLNLLPTFQLPSDGEDITASAVNVPSEDSADRTAWLSERIGGYRVHQVWRSQKNSSNTWASWSIDTATNAGFTRVSGAGGGVAADMITGGAGGSYPDIVNNDFVDVTFTCTVDTTVAGHGRTGFGLAYELLDYGVAPVPTPVNIGGSGLAVKDNVTDEALTLSQCFQLTGLGRGQRLQMYLMAIGFGAGATGFQLTGHACWSLKVLRINS